MDKDAFYYIEAWYSSKEIWGAVKETGSFPPLTFANKEDAMTYDVAISTLNRWKEKYPDQKFRLEKAEL